MWHWHAAPGSGLPSSIDLAVSNVSCAQPISRSAGQALSATTSEPQLFATAIQSDCTGYAPETFRAVHSMANRETDRGRDYHDCGGRYQPPTLFNRVCTGALPVPGPPSVDLGAGPVGDRLTHVQWGSDGVTTSATLGGQAVQTATASPNMYFYFQLDDAFAFDLPPPSEFLVHVTFYDDPGASPRHRGVVTVEHPSCALGKPKGHGVY